MRSCLLRSRVHLNAIHQYIVDILQCFNSFGVGRSSGIKNERLYKYRSLVLVNIKVSGTSRDDWA